MHVATFITCNGVMAFTAPRANFMAASMASSVLNSCKVWDAQISDDAVGPLGDIEHLRDLLGEGTCMRARELFWLTDSTPHESMPLDHDAYRQYFRLVTSSVSVWYEKHSTKNRLGVVPDPTVTRVLSHDKFEVSVTPSNTFYKASLATWHPWTSISMHFEACLVEGPHVVRVAYDGMEVAEVGGPESGYLPVDIGEHVRVLCIQPYEGHTRNKHRLYVYGCVVGREAHGGCLPSSVF